MIAEGGYASLIHSAYTPKRAAKAILRKIMLLFS